MIPGATLRSLIQARRGFVYESIIDDHSRAAHVARLKERGIVISTFRLESMLNYSFKNAGRSITLSRPASKISMPWENFLE